MKSRKLSMERRAIPLRFCRSMHQAFRKQTFTVLGLVVRVRRSITPGYVISLFSKPHGGLVVCHRIVTSRVYDCGLPLTSREWRLLIALLSINMVAGGTCTVRTRQGERSFAPLQSIRRTCGSGRVTHEMPTIVRTEPCSFDLSQNCLTWVASMTAMRFMLNGQA